jgi:hypothetical protein
LLTSFPADSCPWKSLKPSSFTFRLPLWHSEPSATVPCSQVELELHTSVVQGLPSSQPPAHTGAEQVTVAVNVSAQPADVSPSDTLSVSVASPNAVQVKVGFGAVALLSVPLEATH